jgi:hypothetical protein
MARLWFTKLALPALLVGCLAGSAKADLVTTFIGTAPSQQVNVSATKDGTTHAFESPVGPFNFIVLSDSSNTGLGPTFRSFCADFFQEVAVGNDYTYSPVAFADLPDVAGNATKMAKIQELYDRFYDLATDAENGAAFQLALWEILYDPNKSDLSSGNFTASGPGSPTSINVAQAMLDILDDPRYADPVKKYTLTGLHAGDAVAIAVRAVNAGGESLSSEPLAIVVTKPEPAPMPMPMPVSPSDPEPDPEASGCGTTQARPRTGWWALPLLLIAPLLPLRRRRKRA